MGSPFRKCPSPGFPGHSPPRLPSSFYLSLSTVSQGWVLGPISPSLMMSSPKRHLDAERPCTDFCL